MLLLLGISLGFVAGISPGPLMTLVITASLQRGFGAGLRVAIAPLLSDTPIILLSLLVLSALPSRFLAVIGTLGGLFVIFMGVQTLREARTATLDASEDEGTARDVGRGIVVNVLNPHPWVFWATVGGPTFIRAWRGHPGDGLLFLVGFYALLVGSKVGLAWAVASGRRWLSGRWYRRALAMSGILLIGLGTLLARDAIQTRLIGLPN